MNEVKKFVARNATTIINSLVIGGLVSSNILSVKAGAKSTKMIAAEEEKLGRQLTKKEKIKLCWKNYIWTTTTQILTIIGVFGNQAVNNKNKAALLAAYTVSQNSLQTLQTKVAENVDSKKVTKIKDAVNKEIIEEHKDDTPAQTNLIGDKDTIKFIEPLTGRVFMSTWEKISQAALDCNTRIVTGKGGGKITLNDWFEALHLPPIESVIGETMGWYINPMTREEYLITWTKTSDLDSDGKPVACIYYNNQPVNLNEIY